MALGAGKRDQPRDSVTITGHRSPANETYSGPYYPYVDYYSVISGRGLTPATPSKGAPRATTPTPAAPPAPPPPVVAAPPDVPAPGAPDAGPTVEAPLDEVVVTARPPSTVLGGLFPEASFPFYGVQGPTTKPVPSRRTPRTPRRRRSPPDRRTRPVRPRTPAPGPRIPIPVPEVVVTAARRLVPILGVLALVPPYLRMLGRVDAYGTDAMFNRMFPPIPGRKRGRAEDPERPGSAEPDTAGDPVLSGGNAPSLDVPTVVVEGTRPGPLPAPAPLPGPSLTVPGVDYYAPVNSPVRPPATNARRRPKQRFAVDPLSHEYGTPFPQPLPLPLPLAPRSRPVPTGAPNPSGPSAPLPFPAPTPSSPIIGALDPLPEPGPVPVEDPCAQQRARQRKKKRSPRAECWKGTYIEKAQGISKVRRVRVDCGTGAELPSQPAAKAEPSRKRRRYPTSLKDVLNP